MYIYFWLQELQNIRKNFLSGIFKGAGLQKKSNMLSMYVYYT